MKKQIRKRSAKITKTASKKKQDVSGTKRKAQILAFRATSSFKNSVSDLNQDILSYAQTLSW